ncbi:hypothetical protein [Geodermatophilus sp. FMUSA9-8]|uniref:hypothetical protein n=1 Tax=Geodermatophilus sp. FMUSA9-8 TaxID=3120155 RepID=UPI0030080EBC
MRPRPLTALLPLALLAGTALAGCGGPGEDFDPGHQPGAEGITAVIRVYGKAIGEGDGPRACSLMSRAAQEQVMERSGVPGNCLDAVSAIAEPLSDDARTSLADVQVTDIDGEETTSASATATASGAGAEEATAALGGTVFTMSVAEARWGIDSIQHG